MIIVTGAIVATAESYAAILEESLAHVRRSRAEDGCIRHAVHQDAENPLRLFFYEEWRDLAALKAHFAVPESIAFVRSVRARAGTVEAPHVVETVQA